MRKIGLLGGSFDPIHEGHIHVALIVYNALNLDEVWFLPTVKTPLKDRGLSAAIYTQLSDVEDETNGLLTYDREVQKVSSIL